MMLQTMKFPPRTWPSVLVASFILLSVQARSQDAQTIADVRCVIVGVKIAGMTNTSQQSAGAMLALYYIGRLEGRVPKLNIERLMTSELRNMTAADYASETKRCGDALAAKGQQVTQIGQDIRESESLKKPETK